MGWPQEANREASLFFLAISEYKLDCEWEIFFWPKVNERIWWSIYSWVISTLQSWPHYLKYLLSGSIYNSSHILIFFAISILIHSCMVTLTCIYLYSLTHQSSPLLFHPPASSMCFCHKRPSHYSIQNPTSIGSIFTFQHPFLVFFNSNL